MHFYASCHVWFIVFTFLLRSLTFLNCNLEFYFSHLIIPVFDYFCLLSLLGRHMFPFLLPLKTWNFNFSELEKHFPHVYDRLSVYGLFSFLVFIKQTSYVMSQVIMLCFILLKTVDDYPSLLCQQWSNIIIAY